MADDKAHKPTAHDPDTPEYDQATGGWGSLQGVAGMFGEAELGRRALALEQSLKEGTSEASYDRDLEAVLALA